ncbi:hypothetical protein, partial [Caballeronia sp.]|uniref:hypothetical protein n=1 Tax=Caballeronia sp. TaxID=1931223 RepID=UPI002621D90C
MTSDIESSLRLLAAHVHAPVVLRTAGRNPHVVLHICEQSPATLPSLTAPETPTLSPCECKHGAALACIGETVSLKIAVASRPNP